MADLLGMFWPSHEADVRPEEPALDTSGFAHEVKDRTNDVSLGIQLDRNKKGDFFIAGMIKGGGAMRSGQLEEGDRILSINGQRTGGMNLAAVLSLLMGPAGTFCKLEVARKQGGDWQEVQAACERLADDKPQGGRRPVPVSSLEEPSRPLVSEDDHSSKTVMALHNSFAVCVNHRKRFEKLHQHYGRLPKHVINRRAQDEGSSQSEKRLIFGSHRKREDEAR